MFRTYYVYILTSRNRSTLYVGVTNNLQRRLEEHYFDSQNARKSFVGRYKCYNLIYYEEFKNIIAAIAREKEIKKWRREKKNNLIATYNPDWRFLKAGMF